MVLEDPRDCRFTWEEDENWNDSNAKIKDWDDDLNYERAWFIHGQFDDLDSDDLYQYNDAEDWDYDPQRPWCIPGQFEGPEHDEDDDEIAKHDLGGSRTVFNYRCAKIARSGKIAGRRGIPENLSEQMTLEILL